MWKRLQQLHRSFYISKSFTQNQVFTVAWYVEAVRPRRKGVSSHSRSKPSSSVVLDVRVPVPAWEKNDKWKSAASGREKKKKERVQPERICDPIPPGSSHPLYLHQKLLNYNQSLKTVTETQKTNEFNKTLPANSNLTPVKRLMIVKKMRGTMFRWVLALISKSDKFAKSDKNEKNDQLVGLSWPCQGQTEMWSSDVI